MAPRDTGKLSDEERARAIKTFEELGLCVQLAEAAATLGWKSPSPIQQQAVPPLLQGMSTWHGLIKHAITPLHIAAETFVISRAGPHGA